MRQKLVWLMLLATLAMRMEGSNYISAAPPQQDGAQHYPCSEDGKDVPCPDGHYYGADGKEQPATCNNNFDNAHQCVCAKATTPLEQCPENNVQMDMSKCSVYCREDACKCVSVCDFNDGK